MTLPKMIAEDTRGKVTVKVCGWGASKSGLMFSLHTANPEHEAHDAFVLFPFFKPNATSLQFACEQLATRFGSINVPWPSIDEFEEAIADAILPKPTATGLESVTEPLGVTLRRINEQGPKTWLASPEEDSKVPGHAATGETAAQALVQVIFNAITSAKIDAEGQKEFLLRRLRKVSDALLANLNPVALEHGYLLTAYGETALSVFSPQRNRVSSINLVAVPWLDEAQPPGILAGAIRDAAEGAILSGPFDREPHSRQSWVVSIGNVYGLYNHHIDLSIFPPETERYVFIKEGPKNLTATPMWECTETRNYQDGALQSSCEVLPFAARPNTCSSHEGLKKP